MAFDENKYKAIFEQRYGKGSFDVGLQQARNLGRLKAEASQAKKDYTASLKVKKKKTYDDALSYWNDPANKEHLLNHGVGKIENEYLNDPRAKAEIKAQGFNQQDFIDAMYSVASGGKQLSKRGFTQDQKKAKDTVSKKKLPLIPLASPEEIKAKKKAEATKIAKQKSSKERDGLLGFLDSTLGRAGDMATRTLFGEDFSKDMNDNYTKTAKDKLKKDPTDKHAVQALQMQNTTNRKAKNGIEKVSDFVGASAGEIAPYTIGGAYGIAGKAGAKLGLNAIKNPIAKNLITGTAAGTIAGTEKALTRHVASNETLTPKDYAKRIGTEAAFAGVGDAAFTGIGMGLKAASNKTMKGLLPTNEHVATRLGNELKDHPIDLPQEKPMTKLNVGNVFDSLMGNSTKAINEAPVIDDIPLATIKPKKPITSMSKEELQTVRKGLVNRKKAVKGDIQKAHAIQEDIDKLDTQLMTLDLQLFGKGAEAVQPVNNPNRTANPFTANVADEFQGIKDISQLQVGTKNLYEIADRLPKAMGDNIKKSLDTAKVNHVNHLKFETDDLYNYVVKELGIKKGTKESALVQDFGEKTLGKKFLESKGMDLNDVSPEELAAVNLEQLKQKAPDTWEKVVKADEFFRSNYDRLINRVNAVREKIYPRNPEKIVPKRQDYYHHFNVLEGLEGIKNLFDTPANISPKLEGLSPFTRPSAKFQGFMQRRGNGAYKSDAVGGYLKYLKAASHSINMDPVIPVIRNTAKSLADATEESKNANKIIEALVDHANDIAGKTNPYDRVAQKVIGRKGMRIITTLNSRVKSNMILGNFGSMVAQTGNIPLGIAQAKQYALPGLKNTMQQTFKELLRGDRSAPIYKSRFLAERFSDSNFTRFDQRLIDQPKKLAVWAMSTIDKAASRSIWNSMYAKGLKEGVENPIKYADYETRKIVAGRGVGEVPLLQKSNVTQVLAPFTLEVGNQWKVFAEMVGKKDAAAILTYLVAAYGLNKAYSEVRGSNVAYDPIDAIYDGYMHGEGGILKRSLNAAGSLAGETIGNIPGGNLMLNVLPEDKKVPGTDVQFKELWGERNPNRFGEGLPVGKVASDPLYAVLPWGANQLNKTAQGVKAIMNDGVYKGDNGANPFGGKQEELMYPMKSKTPLWDALKLTTMGPSSTSSAQDYYDNQRKPLNETQTKAYELLKKDGKGNQFYDIMRVQDTKASVKAKFTKIMRDPDLSNQEKLMALEDLIAQLQE
jgi:hypothetical protein